MNIKHLFCIIALTTPIIANADTLSFTVGGASWHETPTGNIQKIVDQSPVDITDDFFWKKESQGYVYATLEHPIPVLPNIRLIKSSINHSGSGDTDFTFGGDNFGPSVSNDFSIEMTDIIAYYEILDNVVSIDLGLNIRSLKIDYDINDGVDESPAYSISKTIPMVYAMAGASPMPDLILSAEYSYFSYDGNTISDFTTKISYTTEYYLGLELGYRKQTLGLDDASDTDTNLNFDGAFVGAFIKL